MGAHATSVSRARQYRRSRRRHAATVAVTGGSFDKVDSQGRVARVSSNAARLLVADISDPVHPVIVNMREMGRLRRYTELLRDLDRFDGAKASERFCLPAGWPGAGGHAR